MNLVKIVGLTSVLVAISPAANASLVLFDNLNSARGGSLSVEYQADTLNNFLHAQSFNSGAATLLTSLTLMLTGDPTPNGTFYVALYDKSGVGSYSEFTGGYWKNYPKTANTAPGTLIATLGSGLPVSGVGIPQIGIGSWHYTLSGLSQTLLPNTDYYILIGAEIGSGILQWYTTQEWTASTSALRAQKNAIVIQPDQVWNVYADGPSLMMRVEGDIVPVPEPSTILAGLLLALPVGLQSVRHVTNRKRTSRRSVQKPL